MAMRKMTRTLTVLCLAAMLLLGLTACGDTRESPIPTETTPAVTEATAILTEAATEPTTVPTTEPPRVIGPERLEGNAVTIEHVSVEYMDALPQNIKSSTAYSSSGFKEEFVLNESQVYAVIRFTLTNQTAKEIKVADIHDDFLVELIYDNRYVYSPDSNSWCFFKAGSQAAVVSDSASIGSVTLAPLTAKEITVYIPCAKEVAENPEKYLIVVFTSNYSGYENFEFIIR